MLLVFQLHAGSPLFHSLPHFDETPTSRELLPRCIRVSSKCGRLFRVTSLYQVYYIVSHVPLCLFNRNAVIQLQNTASDFMIYKSTYINRNIFAIYIYVYSMCEDFPWTSYKCSHVLLNIVQFSL